MVMTRAAKSSKKKERLIQIYAVMAASLPECASHLCMQYSRSPVFVSMLAVQEQNYQECIMCHHKLTAERCVCVCLILGA